jgi:hypothetical protein
LYGYCAILLFSIQKEYYFFYVYTLNLKKMKKMKLVKALWVLCMSLILTVACNKDDDETALEIGTLTEGGIVFYIAPEPTDLDGDGDLDTGLVCATEDQSSSVQWSNLVYKPIHNRNYTPSSQDTISYEAYFETRDSIEAGAASASVGSGAMNTATIIAAHDDNHTDNPTMDVDGTYAAALASAYLGGGFDDWFLPSKDELNLMYKNLKLEGLGNFSDHPYWSATYANSTTILKNGKEEKTIFKSWEHHFDTSGYQGYSDEKYDFYKVRAVRAF